MKVEIGLGGIAGVLLVIFIVPKILGKIDWAWGWVLAPLWIPAAVIGAIFILWAIAQSRKQRRG